MPELVTKEPLNREAWLNKFAELLRPWFREHGYPIHGQISITMGALPPRKGGFCYPREASTDGTTRQVIVSAFEEAGADTLWKLEILMHEIAHALMPDGTKHKTPWKNCMKAIGFLKPSPKGEAGMSNELKAHLEKLLAFMPPMPSYGLKRPPAPPPKPKRAGYKFQCDDCKTTLTMQYTSYARAGQPPCWNEDCESCGELMTEK